MPFSGDTLEGVRAAIPKLDARSYHQILHRARHENLARFCRGNNASANVDSDTSHPVSHQLALTYMQTTPDFYSKLPHRLTNRRRTADRSRWTVESREEPVTRFVYHDSPKKVQFAPDKYVVALEEIPPNGIPQRCHAFG